MVTGYLMVDSRLDTDPVHFFDRITRACNPVRKAVVERASTLLVDVRYIPYCYTNQNAGTSTTPGVLRPDEHHVEDGLGLRDVPRPPRHRRDETGQVWVHARPHEPVREVREPSVVRTDAVRLTEC